MRRLSRRRFLMTAPKVAGAFSIARHFGIAQDLPAGRELDLKLWYTQPAREWVDALPIGNGRLGAMVFGGIKSERIALNEDTLWSGAPRDWNNPDAKDHLSVVRKMVIENQDYHGADQECRKMQG